MQFTQIRIHGPALQPVPLPCTKPAHLYSPSYRVACKHRQKTLGAAALLKESQHQDGKPSAMPRLPERPSKAKEQGDSKLAKSSLPSNSVTKRTGRKALPLPPSLPPEHQKHAQERTLAGLLAYSGLLGTVATGIAMVCPDVDLFGNFSMNAADITLGLQLLLPCCLLNLAIMLPDYSSWKVPPEPTLEAQQCMAESLLAWTAKQKAAGAAGSSTKATAQDPAAATQDTPQTSSTAAAAAAAAADSSRPGPALSDPRSAAATHAACSEDTITSGSSSSSSAQSSTIGASISQSSSSSSGLDEAATPGVSGAELGVSPPWLISNPEPPLPLVLARCKDALLMAQAHYLASTPRVALPWHMQAGVLLINCMAAELLYRSVTLQVSGGWLTDRILEAGAEDWFLSAAAHLPVLPTPHMTGQLLAVGVLSAAWGVAVARQVLRMTRRPSMVLASQGRVAAGQLLEEVRSMVAGRAQQEQDQQHHEVNTKQEQQKPQTDNQQQADGSVSSIDVSEEQQQEQASSSTGGSALRDSSSTSSKQSPSRAAAQLALVAAAGDASSSGKKGPGGKLPNALSALALSQIVTGVRDLSQSAGLGLAFALTSNLAAPFVAAVVTEGLMVVLQRRGQERSRQRSIAFTKHFANFTRVLRDAQRKQLLDKQAQEAAGEQQQHATTQPPADHPQAEALPLASSAPASQGSSADHALDAAVAAAVAPDVAALHVAESQGAVSAAAPTGGSRMEQTISVLDQLLGEQLAEQAAAAGPHSK